MKEDLNGKTFHVYELENLILFNSNNQSDLQIQYNQYQVPAAFFAEIYKL